MARVYMNVVSLLIVLTSSSIVLAQEAWPTYPLDGHNITRGSGHYFAWWKLLLIWLLFLLWVKTTDWVNRDTQILQLNHSLWNAVNFFPFFLVLLALTLTVAFPLGYSALVLAWLVPLGIYIFQRNANVEEHEKVLTPAHFRHMLAGKTGIDAEKKAAHERGAPVTFQPTSGESNAKNEANVILARQSEGYVGTKDLVADAVDQRATKLMLDTTAEQVSVRYQIDGVWHEADPLDREAGDSTVEVLKRLSNADVAERRKRQSGEMAIKYKDLKCRGVLVSQGTKTGERTILSLVRDGMEFESLEEAGMREGLQTKLKAMLNEPNGWILFSSIPSGGLSTTVALAGKMSDRYMRDFISFQDVNKPEPVAENITIETFDGKKDDVRETLRTVFRKEPDCVIVHELNDKSVGELMCEQAAEDKLILTTIGAKEAVEALLRVLLLKIPAKSVAPLVHGVVNQRLVRKLCEDCKEEYAPSPALLKKLGLPAGRVDSFYQPPTYEENDKPCTKCAGLGYLGRTSIYEVLEVNDKIREALVKQPKLDVLRTVARKSGHRGLQQEGILLVAKGVTSLAELQRVMKQ